MPEAGVRSVLRRFAAASVLVALASGFGAGAKLSVDDALLAGLRWRAVGPAVFGGRVSDVAGVPGNPNILYVAFASAGLFKSKDGGISFESVFGSGNTLSIGAVALAPDNPDVVYVATGEGKPRNSTSFGDGIYRSIDGGKTWTHLGLSHTERFARLALHPRDSNIIYAAAMGHEWGPNEERGVYRSTDAGRTWTRVLFVNNTTGASDASSLGGGVFVAPNKPYGASLSYFLGEGPVDGARVEIEILDMECSIRRALEGIASGEKQLTGLEPRVSAAREALRGIRDRFESDPRGASPLNLSRKVTRLREEIEAYTGRPTTAQLEWIGVFDQQLQDVLRSLEKVSKDVSSITRR